MVKTTYFFQNQTDRKWVIPITHSSSYNAVQELRNRAVKTDEWRLVKITETTFCNRSISQIESDYKALHPKYDRKVNRSEES